MQNEMIQLTVANTLDQASKQRVEVQPNQTLKQAVQEKNLAPKGAFDIYDQMGKVISNQAAANHRDSTVYVGVAKVAGGAMTRPAFDKLQQTDYPSLRHINQHSNKGKVGAFVMTIPGVHSHRDASQVMYVVLVDAREFPQLPKAYVLTPHCADIEHVNIHEASSYSIAPSKELCAVCVGSEFTSDVWPAIRDMKASDDEKMGMFLNQLLMVLKNPNNGDAARVV